MYPNFSVNLPKYGFVLYEEWTRYYDGLAEIEKDSSLTSEQRAARIRGLQASQVLQRVDPRFDESRIGRVWMIPDDQGNACPAMISDLLVTELSKFFLGELNHWIPSGLVMLIEHEDPERSKELAIAEAEKQGLIVLTRDDLILSGMFILFRKADCPTGGTPPWEVVADHSPEDIEA